MTEGIKQVVAAYLTLRQFQKHYMDILNKKTTLIIIGDGRSNYANPQEQILDEMRQRSRRVIWLNPETQSFWYTGDSEMRIYQACCDEVRPCQNLNQLLDFIKSLVLWGPKKSLDFSLEISII